MNDRITGLLLLIAAGLVSLGVGGLALCIGGAFCMLLGFALVTFGSN
jgi:hypothetical protein